MRNVPTIQSFSFLKFSCLKINLFKLKQSKKIRVYTIHPNIFFCKQLKIFFRNRRIFQGIKKDCCRSNSPDFQQNRKSADLNNKSIALNGTVEGKTEEGVVVDFTIVFADGGTERTASGESASDSTESNDHEKLFHTDTSLSYCG